MTQFQQLLYLLLFYFFFLKTNIDFTAYETQACSEKKGFLALPSKTMMHNASAEACMKQISSKNPKWYSFFLFFQFSVIRGLCH